MDKFPSFNSTGFFICLAWGSFFLSTGDANWAQWVMEKQEGNHEIPQIPLLDALQALPLMVQSRSRLLRFHNELESWSDLFLLQCLWKGRKGTFFWNNMPCAASGTAHYSNSCLIRFSWEVWGLDCFNSSVIQICFLATITNVPNMKGARAL